jgi:hypothetical protein
MRKTLLYLFSWVSIVFIVGSLWGFGGVVMSTENFTAAKLFFLLGNFILAVKIVFSSQIDNERRAPIIALVISAAVIVSVVQLYWVESKRAEAVKSAKKNNEPPVWTDSGKTAGPETKTPKTPAGGKNRVSRSAKNSPKSPENNKTDESKSKSTPEQDQIQLVYNELKIPTPTIPPFQPSKSLSGAYIMPGDSLFETGFTLVNGAATRIRDIRISCRMIFSIIDQDHDFPPQMIMRWPQLAGNGGADTFRCFTEAKYFLGQNVPVPVTCADVGVLVQFRLDGQDVSKPFISKTFRFVAANGYWAPVQYDAWQSQHCWRGRIIGFEPELPDR